MGIVARAILMEAWVKPSYKDEAKEWEAWSKGVSGGEKPRGPRLSTTWRGYLQGGDPHYFKKDVAKAKLVSLPPHKIKDIEPAIGGFNEPNTGIEHVRKYRGDRDVNRIIRGMKDFKNTSMPAPGLWIKPESNPFKKRRMFLVGGNHRFGISKAMGIAPKFLAVTKKMAGGRL